MSSAFFDDDDLVILTGYVRAAEVIAAARRSWDDPEHESGVYFLFLDAALQYVGQAISISTRLDQHRYPDWPSLVPATWFNQVSTVEVLDEYPVLNAVECYYIHKLRPPRNIKYPRPNRYARAMLNG